MLPLFLPIIIKLKPKNNMSGHKNLKMEILELRKQGKSYREIEKRLNCVRSTIHYHCNKHNVTDNGKKRYAITNETKLAISNYCKLNTTSKAQKYFNVSKSTIFKFRNFQLEKDEQE